MRTPGDAAGHRGESPSAQRRNEGEPTRESVHLGRAEASWRGAVGSARGGSHGRDGTRTRSCFLAAVSPNHPICSHAAQASPKAPRCSSAATMVRPASSGAAAGEGAATAPKGRVSRGGGCAGTTFRTDREGGRRLRSRSSTCAQKAHQTGIRAHMQRSRAAGRGGLVSGPDVGELRQVRTLCRVLRQLHLRTPQDLRPLWLLLWWRSRAERPFTWNLSWCPWPLRSSALGWGSVLSGPRGRCASSCDESSSDDASLDDALLPMYSLSDTECVTWICGVLAQHVESPLTGKGFH